MAGYSSSAEGSKPDQGAAPESPTVPQPGDKIVIHWPGGPDFHMEFLGLDETMPAAHPGWLFLHGIVGYTEATRFFAEQPTYQTLYARPIGPGEYEMKPRLL